MSVPTQLAFLLIGAHGLPVFFLGVIHKIFQGASYPRLVLKVVRKSYLCPHAARSYRIKLQRQGYTARRMTDNIYHEKSQLNRLVWGSLTLAPISMSQTCLYSISYQKATGFLQ